jgi:hypothetical protein
MRHVHLLSILHCIYRHRFTKYSRDECIRLYHLIQDIAKWFIVYRLWNKFEHETFTGNLIRQQLRILFLFNTNIRSYHQCWYEFKKNLNYGSTSFNWEHFIFDYVNYVFHSECVVSINETHSRSFHRRHRLFVVHNMSY